MVDLAVVALNLPGPSGAEQGYESETAIKSNDFLSIQTIAILGIPEPPNYGRDKRFELENAEYQGLSFGSTAQALLKNYLTENGFEVIEYSPNRENEHRLMYDYSSLDIKGADAYLDVVPIEVEYKFRWQKTGPHVSTSFRLVSADSNEKIYSGSLQYGWKDSLTRSAGVKIESPEDHEYESSEALKANKGEAVEWLVQGIEAVSLIIGKGIVEGKPANPLSSEKIGTRTSNSISDSNFSSVNVSGIFNVEVSSNSINFYRWIFNNRKNFRIELIQQGNSVTGMILEDKVSSIKGNIDGSKIKFDWYTTNCSNGTGEWTVQPSGQELRGTWSCTTYGSGKWNLTIIK